MGYRSLMANETSILARFAASLRFEALPEAVVRRAKALTLDLLGSAARARGEAAAAPAILAMLADLGLDGPGSATVIGDARGYAPPVAALLNGALGHALDFDDTHAPSSLHPSAPVVPAALAAGEAVGASGETVLAGIVAGYEVICRLGETLDPTAHYARGFHPTATAGVFAAAAAAGRVMGLSPDQMVSAFGVAGSQAAGSLQFLEDGAWNKSWQVGAAAMNGLIAANLAAKGFKGAGEAIEGRRGLLAGYTDGARPERAVQGLGAKWKTLEIAVKPYPCCRYAHGALDALIALKAEHGLAADDVRGVQVGLHRNGVALVGEPAADKRRPANIVQGQFSMYFTGAVALAQGRFGWDNYALIGDPRIEALAERIAVWRDEALETGRPHPFGARVRLVTDQGDFEREVADPSGEPQTFPDEAAQRAKFLALAEPVLGDGALRLAESIWRLETFARTAQALEAARPAG